MQDHLKDRQGGEGAARPPLNMDSIEERRWYIVQTYAGYENRVKANLEQRIATMGMEDLIYAALVPVEERVSVKDGKAKK